MSNQVGEKHDRETLLGYQLELALSNVRRLRMALRNVLPHAPENVRRYAEKVLEETR